MKTNLILFVLLLFGIPTQTLAMNDSEEESFYKDWYRRITDVLDNVSSREALDMIDEMRNYAEDHGSKYGFFIVSILNAHIAKEMGVTDRAEELLQESINYQKRYLSNRKPLTQVYYHLANIYEEKHQGEKAIQLIDEALKQKGWCGEDSVVLWSIKCNAVTYIDPVDTARFMDYYEQMHALIKQYGYNGRVATYTECYHALYTNDYSRLLMLAEKITNKGHRLRFKIMAYDGLERNQEAIDSFKVYKAWIQKQFNEEIRKLAKISALEMESARAENEAETLRLTNQRMLLIAIVCGLCLFVVFLTIYLYRRQWQMRQLKLAYDQLEDVTTQKERIESELRIARTIQLSMVPSVFPICPDINIYGCMTPAKTVGGDLYDFFVRDNQLFFCIGDVSGKGVPAALLMTVTKSLFRAFSSNDCMPDQIVSRMNDNLSENNKERMFVTLFVGILDLTSGLLRYCNGGHEAPVIIDKEAHLLPINHIFPVGAVPATSYKMQETVIESQTTILLYTDGLNEALNADKEKFGKERILNEANRAIQAGKLSPKALIEQLTRSVHQFVGDTEQSDDLTMLAINYLKQ